MSFSAFIYVSFCITIFNSLFVIDFFFLYNTPFIYSQQFYCSHRELIIKTSRFAETIGDLIENNIKQIKS